MHLNMRNITVGIVFVLLIILGLDNITAAPLAWGITLNHKTKECAPYWGGDECYQCDLLSDWESYYETHFLTIKTPYGSCYVEDGTDYSDCCEQLGLKAINPLTTINEGNIYIEDEDEFFICDRYINKGVGEYRGISINKKTKKCSAYMDHSLVRNYTTERNGKDVTITTYKSDIFNQCLLDKNWENYDVVYDYDGDWKMITPTGECDFQRYNEEECCNQLDYTYVSRLSAEDKVYNCSNDKRPHCCNSGRHSDVCENILINHKGERCAFVENISDCRILPENWEKLGPVEEWEDNAWYCPDDYKWLVDNELYYDAYNTIFIDCNSNIDPIAGEYLEDREVISETELDVPEEIIKEESDNISVFASVFYPSTGPNSYNLIIVNVTNKMDSNLSVLLNVSTIMWVNFQNEIQSLTLNPKENKLLYWISDLNVTEEYDEDEAYYYKVQIKVRSNFDTLSSTSFKIRSNDPNYPIEDFEKMIPFYDRDMKKVFKENDSKENESTSKEELNNTSNDSEVYLKEGVRVGTSFTYIPYLLFVFSVIFVLVLIFFSYNAIIYYKNKKSNK